MGIYYILEYKYEYQARVFVIHSTIALNRKVCALFEYVFI